MKQWLSQFKTFLTNSQSRPLPIICGIGAFVCVVIVIVSCRFHQSVVSDPVGSDASKERDSGFLASLFTSRKTMRLTDAETGTAIGSVSIQDCSAYLTPRGSETLRFKVEFDSALGSHTAVFHYPAQADSRSMQVAIEKADQSFSIPINRPLPSNLLEAVCTAAENGDEAYSHNLAALRQHITEWVHASAPDCELTSRAERWFCTMEAIDPALAKRELTSIQRTMIRRWSRQPYVMSRRVAITIMLADALKAEQVDEALDAFCRVINFSEAFELPLATASAVWRRNVCSVPEQRSSATGRQRMMAASLGLTKALSEIEFSRKLFEQTSKLGILSIKIPRSTAPSKDLWISLLPQADVTANLAEFDTSKRDRKGVDEWPACWHPLFPDKQDMIIARHMDLVGSGRQIKCPAFSNSTETWKIPARYLANSITSETEFVITNGRSKILRLPAGTYRYSIRAHSEDMGYEPPPEETTSGDLKWAKRRPSATIRKWN